MEEVRGSSPRRPTIVVVREIEGTTMKKLFLIILAAAAAALAGRRMKAGQQEQALWAEATDNVDKA